MAGKRQLPVLFFFKESLCPKNGKGKRKEKGSMKGSARRSVRGSASSQCGRAPQVSGSTFNSGERLVLRAARKKTRDGRYSGRGERERWEEDEEEEGGKEGGEVKTHLHWHS